LGEALGAVEDAETVGLNGNTGQVYVNPPDAALQNLRRAVQVSADERAVLGALATRPAIRPDGTRIDL
jgi:phosphoenolpyruvate-protein kinase (PTS system EI component)